MSISFRVKFRSQTTDSKHVIVIVKQKFRVRRGAEEAAPNINRGSIIANPCSLTGHQRQRWKYINSEGTSEGLWTAPGPKKCQNGPLRWQLEGPQYTFSGLPWFQKKRFSLLEMWQFQGLWRQVEIWREQKIRLQSPFERGGNGLVQANKYIILSSRGTTHKLIPALVHVNVRTLSFQSCSYSISYSFQSCNQQSIFELSSKRGVILWETRPLSACYTKNSPDNPSTSKADGAANNLKAIIELHAIQQSSNKLSTVPLC